MKKGNLGIYDSGFGWDIVEYINDNPAGPFKDHLVKILTGTIKGEMGVYKGQLLPYNSRVKNAMKQKYGYMKSID